MIDQVLVLEMEPVHDLLEPSLLLLRGHQMEIVGDETIYRVSDDVEQESVGEHRLCSLWHASEIRGGRVVR
jgi:hypothetical protein